MRTLRKFTDGNSAALWFVLNPAIHQGKTTPAMMQASCNQNSGVPDAVLEVSVRAKSVRSCQNARVTYFEALAANVLNEIPRRDMQ